VLLSRLTIPVDIPREAHRDTGRTGLAAGGDRVAGVSGSALSRRAVLWLGGTGLAGVVALGGCDLDPTSSSPPPSPPDPDQPVLDAARLELTRLITRLSATHGGAGLVAVHRLQLAALQGEPPSSTRRARALTPHQVLDGERRAVERFTRWATTCENGDLARVLASIAAGIAMQPDLGSGS
jgi:hypothetical protein